MSNDYFILVIWVIDFITYGKVLLIGNIELIVVFPLSIIDLLRKEVGRVYSGME